MTVIEIINWGVSLLENSGLSHPTLNVERILTHILKKKKVDLYLSANDSLSACELSEAKKLIKQRSTHYPLQYLLGDTSFYGLDFVVNEHVLIPRPETEILVEQLVDYIQNFLSHLNEIYILDLCTGSGNIAIAIAKQVANVKVVAIDVSYASLKVAKTNILKNQVQKNVFLLNSDLLSAVSDKFKWDIIVSNPPYINEHDYALLPKEVKAYEPKLALHAGEEGMDFYCRIIRDGKLYLKKEARFFFEIGETQTHLIEEFVKKENGVKIERIIKDYNDKDRVVILNREE